MDPESGSAPHPCRNCGSVPALQFPPPRYCAACGQETALHPPTLGEFLHEFVGHYVALEGSLWRTLAMLVMHPGRLTREYLAGRRRRYVLPLRLYLTASFLFFLVLKVIPSAIGEVQAPAGYARSDTTIVDLRGERIRLSRVLPGRPASAAPVAAGASGASGAAVASGAAGSSGTTGALSAFGASGASAASMEDWRASDCGTPGHAACNAFQAWLNRLMERWGADPRGFAEHMHARIIAIAPYAVFLMLPVFAGIVKRVYRRRGMTYGEHFVFSLHLHAFWFLVLLAMALLPKGVSDLVQFAIPVYGTWALHEVYGGGWGSTLARACVVSILYGLVLLAGIVTLSLALLSLA